MSTTQPNKATLKDVGERISRTWLDMSTPRFFRFELWTERTLSRTITKQRVKGCEWYGYKDGDGHKYGPFETRKKAIVWAESP